MARRADLSGYAKRDAPGGGLLTAAGALQLVAICSFIYLLVYLGNTVRVILLAAALVTSAAIGIWLYLRVQRMRAPLRAANQLDYDASRTISERLPAIEASIAPVASGGIQAWPEVQTFQGLTIKELIPQLDDGAFTAIDAILNERVAAGLPHTLASTAPMGQPVTTPYAMWFPKQIRQRKTTGFVIVMLQASPDGWRGPIHVVVPAAETARELVGAFVAALANSCGKGSYRESAVHTRRRQMMKQVGTHAEAASAWLTALLQQPLDRRPSVSVVGVVLSNQAILAGALLAGAAPQQYAFKLFPLELVYQLPALVEEATLSAAARAQ